MPFGADSVREAFEKCFVRAVDRAGFELRPVTDGQPAGVIDDHIRVAIRRARFVIADLTGGNHGAYWEAGFGDGLGKPVIYTCEADQFEKQKTHFDTNHCLTVPWSLNDLPAAENRLVATIRATLPAEAKMED
jgi:nucleoside 2-deoxyribosyltransferase